MDVVAQQTIPISAMLMAGALGVMLAYAWARVWEHPEDKRARDWWVWIRGRRLPWKRK